VTNYGERDISTSIVIRLDGVLWESDTEILPAEDQFAFIFELDEPFTTIEAEIIPAEDEADQLPLDNIAWTVAAGGGARQALWISADNNLFMEQVLRSIPSLTTVRGNASSERLPAQEFDLYIFDGWLPDVLPDGDMLIINPPRGTSLFTVGNEIENTANIRLVQRDDPRLAFVDVSEMNLRAFRRVTDTGWADVLMETDGGALLLSGETDDARQIALLTFNLRDSDLPLQIAFPILISNLIEWFTPADMLNIPAGLRVADTVTIRPSVGVDSVTVTAPTGESTDFTADGRPITYANTTQPGLYSVDLLQEGEIVQSQAFAVNLFGLDESDITPVPVDELILGGSQSVTDDDDQLGVREFWALAAFLALLMLLIEWYVYHRRLQVPTVMRPLRRAVAR